MFAKHSVEISHKHFCYSDFYVKPTLEISKVQKMTKVDFTEIRRRGRKFLGNVYQTHTVE